MLKRLDELLIAFRQEVEVGVRSRNHFVLASSRPDDKRHHAFRDCRRVARFSSWIEVFDLTLAEINRRAIEEMEHFGAHAGVVALAGRTIAFPAESGMGKTTLVAACLQNGFKYVSDEALCLDYADSLVVAYPKPLNLTSWSLATLGLPRADEVTTKTPVTPEELGSSAARPRSRLTDVVMLERRPGQANLEGLPTSQVVAALVKASFNHYKRPADTYMLINSVARGARGWSLGYEDPSEAARLLFASLS